MSKTVNYPYATGVLEALVGYAIRELRSNNIATRAEARKYLQEGLDRVERILRSEEEPVL